MLLGLLRKKSSVELFIINKINIIGTAILLENFE